MYDISFSVSGYATSGWGTKKNVPQNGSYTSISGRVLGFGPRELHGNWTWKPACAAELRLTLMPRAKREVIVVKRGSMFEWDQRKYDTGRQAWLTEANCCSKVREEIQGKKYAHTV